MRFPLRLLLVVLTAACAESSPAPTAVAAEGFLFRPQAVTIAAGESVSWTNRDDVLHTVTAGTPEAPSSQFDLPLESGATAATQLSEPGSYPYFCSVHTHMRGVVEVTGG